jgi:hypothetical protein
MNFTFAKRMENLGKEEALEVLAKAKALEKQGKNIKHRKLVTWILTHLRTSRKP